MAVTDEWIRRPSNWMQDHHRLGGAFGAGADFCGVRGRGHAHQQPQHEVAEQQREEFAANLLGIARAQYERPKAPFDSWVAVSNGVDFLHLRTLHGLPAASMPDRVEVDDAGIEFTVETPFHPQHGRISGTNVFAQHLRIGGKEMLMLFSGTPVESGWSSGHFVVGVLKGEEGRLPEVKAMVERLNAEDVPVLRAIRFRRGLLTASDRHLARYFQYVEAFPTFMPPLA